MASPINILIYMSSIILKITCKKVKISRKYIFSESNCDAFTLLKLIEIMPITGKYMKKFAKHYSHKGHVTPDIPS